MRSQKRQTGLKASLTEMSGVAGDSSCWRTGATWRVAKMSPGRRRTGTRLIVAPAAAVTMLVAPGPTDVVQARVARRFAIFA